LKDPLDGADDDTKPAPTIVHPSNCKCFFAWLTTPRLN
jgi:hypothetical protein